MITGYLTRKCSQTSTRGSWCSIPNPKFSCQCSDASCITALRRDSTGCGWYMSLQVKQKAKCPSQDLMLIFVLQDLSGAVSPSPPQFLSISFQLWAALLFLLCIALWENSHPSQKSTCSVLILAGLSIFHAVTFPVWTHCKLKICSELVCRTDLGHAGSFVNQLLLLALIVFLKNSSLVSGVLEYWIRSIWPPGFWVIILLLDHWQIGPLDHLKVEEPWSLNSALNWFSSDLTNRSLTVSCRNFLRHSNSFSTKVFC